MPDMNQREYQIVILGALLHDVGKGNYYFFDFGMTFLGGYNQSTDAVLLAFFLKFRYIDSIPAKNSRRKHFFGLNQGKR